MLEDVGQALSYKMVLGTAPRHVVHQVALLSTLAGATFTGIPPPLHPRSPSSSTPLRRAWIAGRHAVDVGGALREEGLKLHDADGHDPAAVATVSDMLPPLPLKVVDVTVNEFLVTLVAVGEAQLAGTGACPLASHVEAGHSLAVACEQQLPPSLCIPLSASELKRVVSMAAAAVLHEESPMGLPLPPVGTPSGARDACATTPSLPQSGILPIWIVFGATVVVIFFAGAGQ